MDIGKMMPDESLQDGNWVSYDPQTRVRLAYTGSQAFQLKVRAKMKPYRQALQRSRDVDDVLSPQSQDNLAIETLVSDVVLDWEGLELSGSPFPYSKDNARMILQAAPEFRAWVEDEARRVSNFRKKEAEEEAKNLEASSVGS